MNCYIVHIDVVLETLQKLEPKLAEVGIVRRDLVKYPTIQKVLLNHTISTPYMVQFLKVGVHQPCDRVPC